jgi:putative PEP-CTERM system integral membrane protein
MYSVSPQPSQPPELLGFRSALFHFLFWVFNMTLILIVYAGVFPFLGIALISDAIAGKVPLNLLIPFIGLLGTPATCAIAGAQQKKAKVRLPLSQLFFALEAPILTICMVRFFMLRDLTPAASFLLISGVLGLAASLYWFWQKRQADTPEEATGNLLSLIGLSLFFFTSLYLAAIASFFVLPTLVGFVISIPYLIVPLFVIFPVFIFIGVLFTLPFGMVWVARQLWWQNLQQSMSQYGKFKVVTGVTSLAIAWLFGLSTLQQQPQIEAFRLLNQTNPTNRPALVQKSETIRQGLLNAYLSDYRYLRHEDDRAVFNAYNWMLFPKDISNGLQAAYNVVTQPFTYVGDRRDRQTASNLYSQFFDAPIIRREGTQIRTAVESTFNRGEAKAGLLDIGAERVRLANQEVTIKPQGDWAEVELYEVYENQTLDDEEILYYFSLPESAAVTGVWLGETGDRAKSFPFQVATRGAAQQVYNNEVRRNVDPALLEQVGPQNYRLRVYPVLPQKQMHMWMTYKVMKQDKDWPMPRLNEKRNVFWTWNTRRMVNGKQEWSGSEWLPESIAADSSTQKFTPVAHQFALPSGGNVLAKPFDVKDYSLPKGQKLAIVLDSTYSMSAHRPAAQSTFKWLQDNIAPHNQVDLYVTAAAPAKPSLEKFQGFDLNKTVFYGTMQPREMLQQFQTLQQDKKYDAVVMITDAGSYELTEDKSSVLNLSAPLWMVHLGGLQPAYDDATLEAIQSSGGSVATDVETVMRRIGTAPSLGANTSLLSVVDGYSWFLSQAADPTAKTEDGFAPIAARQWVTQVSQSLKPDQLKELDAVHVLAKRYQMVTPYSSMIVLVNDRQKDDLKRAEQGSDRFKREVEDQQLPQPSGLGEISAVPEPEEWLLIVVGLLLLGVVYRQRERLSW